MPRAYYNEIDPFAAEWIRVLITYGLIAEGDVDTRSIEDVKPNDLAGYTQCHFFAGIAGWSHALRLAGWPDSRPVWTLSCPCQPFSAAGKGNGFTDERHLWPAAHWLIAQCRPRTIFGEQVASKDGLAWLDLVQTDLERTAYSSGAVDICAAGIGAPHIRQRLYWRADSLLARRDARGTLSGNGQTAGMRGVIGSSDSLYSQRWQVNGPRSNERDGSNSGRSEAYLFAGARSEVLISSDSNSSRCGQGRSSETADRSGETWEQLARLRSTIIPQHTHISSNNERSSSGEQSIRDLDHQRRDSSSQGLQEQFEQRRLSRETMGSSAWEAFIGAGHTRGFWADCDWWYGRDEKYRPIESGVQPLAHGVSGRMGKLRGYGNAIVPPLAAEFIQASEEITL